MIVNIIVLSAVGVFFAYVVYSACRAFIGHNPAAPGWWQRFKKWAIDPEPAKHFDHADARYHYCEQCGESDGNGRPGGSCCVQCLDDEIEALR